MDIGARRQYGNAEIGGHATLHQGDAHTSAALNIFPGNTINISVQGNIDCSSIARKRLLDPDDRDQGQCTAKRKRLHNENHCHDLNFSHRLEPKRSSETPYSQQERYSRLPTAHDHNLRNQGIHLVNQILRASGSEEQVSPTSIGQANVHDGHALNCLRSAFCASTQARKGVLLTLVDNLRQNSLFPAIARVFPNSPASVGREAFHEAITLPSDTATAPTSVYGPAEDLICVFLSMLAMFSCHEAGQGRNNNTHLALKFKPSFSQVPLIAGLITFALARYFCIPSMLRQISEWAGGSLIILDPFLHDLRVPKAHIEHFTLLEAFLRLRLSGTTAEAFVEAGQFNLTLGQRYGRAISKSDWSVKGRVKSDQRVVMSVFLKRQDARCIQCQA